MMPQRLVKDSWLKVRARLMKARTRRVDSHFDINEVPHTGARASLPDHVFVSPRCRSENGVHYVRVKILSDIPAFIGLDANNYNLHKGDVAFVPCANARVLCERALAALGEGPSKSPPYNVASCLREEDTCALDTS